MNVIQPMEMTFVMMTLLAQTMVVPILVNVIQDIKIPRRLQWDMFVKVRFLFILKEIIFLVKLIFFCHMSYKLQREFRY